MEIQPNDILKELERALYIYFKLTTRESMQVSKNLSMTHSELEILELIAATDDCSVTDIARKAEMTLAGASLYVSKLEKKGVVKKDKNPRKLSQRIITPTRLGTKARKLHGDYHARHNTVLLDFLGSLDQGDLKTSHKLATSITAWMQSFHNEAEE